MTNTARAVMYAVVPCAMIAGCLTSVFTDTASSAHLSAARDHSTVSANHAAGNPNQPVALSDNYERLITKYAYSEGVPVVLAKAIVKVESNFQADATGAAGEVGLMQIKPATARGMGYNGTVEGLYAPETNLLWGMKYLAKAHQLAKGNTCGTIVRYVGGHGATKMTEHTKKYCTKVKNILNG